jgi:Raffinose synthase or seed imbibition protein Sip1
MMIRLKLLSSILIFILGSVIILFNSCNSKTNKTALNHIPEIIDVNSFTGEGLIKLEKQEFKPDSNGIIADIKINLGTFEKAVYYRPFSDGVASGNRVEPLWFDEVTDLVNYKNQAPRMDDALNLGAFLMLKKSSGKYLVLLPVVSSTIGNTFAVYDDAIYLRMATYGTKTENTQAPLLAYAESENPYEATHMAWELAKNAEGVKGNVNWRSDKEYAEPFKYLGWCSWEHFRTNINEENILKSINDIKNSDLPFRWVLVDDGYLDHENKRLLSFGTDKTKFPNGWEPITSQKDDKIKWMGLWRNMQGYMKGISPEHSMEDLREHITKVEFKTDTYYMPRITPESAEAFYNAMTSQTKEAGFDIIKVDFQSDNFRFNWGSENAVRAVHYNNMALEENCVKYGLDLINCIAQQNFNVFNQKFSCVIRGSVDYKTTMDRVDLTLVQNFTNAFWLGHLHWIDQDMFHTSFKETARLMAVCRALSGGPVYLSDETTQIDDTFLKPIIYNDGKIVGTLAPAVPLPESMMSDPYTGGTVFKVIAPIENKTAAILAVNLNRDVILKASVSLKDYPYAASLIQPYNGLWEIPEEGVLLYDSYNKSAELLLEDYQFELGTREEKLFQLSPIRHGWSVIGRPDKYLSAGTFKYMEVSQEEISIHLIENGSILIWCKDKTPVSDNFDFKLISDALWEGEIVKSSKTGVYKIRGAV